MRREAVDLRSLVFFKPYYMSLLSPHQLWTTAGHNPFKVAMATVQARFLSGRYRCGSLTRHWTGGEGKCLMSSICMDVLEDIPHIISSCPALSETRRRLYDYTLRYSSFLPVQLMDLIRWKCSSDNPSFVEFVLDCSTDPDVITHIRHMGKMFYIIPLQLTELGPSSFIEKD